MPVGFVSASAQPGQIKNAWRLARTVVLPDYQGMGIGTSISDAVAEILWREGKRVYTKVMSPAIARHREGSALWFPTAKNGKARGDYKKERQNKGSGHKMKHKNRVCYCHEYKRGSTYDNN